MSGNNKNKEKTKTDDFKSFIDNIDTLLEAMGNYMATKVDLDYEDDTKSQPAAFGDDTQNRPVTCEEKLDKTALSKVNSERRILTVFQDFKAKLFRARRFLSNRGSDRPSKSTTSLEADFRESLKALDKRNVLPLTDWRKRARAMKSSLKNLIAMHDIIQNNGTLESDNIQLIELTTCTLDELVDWAVRSKIEQHFILRNMASSGGKTCSMQTLGFKSTNI